jgi:hypothetical protein
MKYKRLGPMQTVADLIIKLENKEICVIVTEAPQIENDLNLMIFKMEGFMINLYGPVLTLDGKYTYNFSLDYNTPRHYARGVMNLDNLKQINNAMYLK